MTRVTVISGFLGAGKTTFANLLLNYYIRKGFKTAYIVNEFGKAEVDSGLIAQKGFRTVGIAGGCVCCALRGKISEALREVVKNFAPDRAVFEPSGIFIFEKFREILDEPFIRENCGIDGVITVVDSTRAMDAMFVEGNFFANQVAHADTLVLSKTQLKEARNPRIIIDKIRKLNERAGIWAKPWDSLTDDDFTALDSGGGAGLDADGDDDGHDRHHEHDHHHHGDGEELLHEELDTITITPRDLDEASLEELRRMTRDGAFGKLYRAKGRVMYDGVPKLLQAVFESVDIDENPPGGECCLTFIGCELDGAKIRKYWGA
ncbi:MAG: hypothetical protein LBE65_00425 [Synergistaceae bacterium]|nr:hypothetical protein [Synergistaceae bacterium]